MHRSVRKSLPQPGSPLSPSAKHWRLASRLVTFVGLLAASAPNPFLPVMVEDLHTSVVLLGQIIALSLFLAAGIGLLIGPLADRYGYRLLLLVGIFAAVVTAVGVAMASTVATLLLAILVSAVTRAITQPVSTAIAGTRFAGEARRRAISWVVSALSAAPIIGISAMTTLASSLGWRAAFVALAILAAGVGVFTLAVVPRDESHADQPLRLDTWRASFAPLLQHSPTLALIGAYTLRFSSVTMLVTYLGAYLVQSFGLSTEQIGIVYMVVGLGFLLGSLAAGGRLGRAPLRPVVIVTSLLLTCGMAGAFILPLSVAGAVGLITVAALAAGYGTVAISTLLMTESPAGRATTMTLTHAVISLGGAGGAALGGLLLEFGGYAAIGLSIPILGVVAASPVWGTRARAVT
ncbi:MAG TPA: MFS transporter [Chloroflexota bacterium]|nr:MFS transporter [Chloroflexota bacterium]